MAISSLGVGSGIDLNNMLSQLMAVERQPLTRLQTKQNTFNSQISALGQIKNTIDALKTASKALTDPASLYSGQATVANTSIAKASAAFGAVNGTYDITVEALASTHKLVSSAQASNFADGGSLTFETNGNAVKVSFAENSSLSDVASTINSANAGVTATLINGEGGERLVISSKESGAANQIKITSSGGLAGKGLDYGPSAPAGSWTETSAGSDARLTIDGVNVTSASNSVKNAITGVTLDLLATTAPGTKTTLTVTADSSTLNTKVEEFVKAYNSAVSTMKDLSKYNASGTSGVLNGDSSVRSLLSQLSNAVLPDSANLAGTHLFDLGISYQTDGSLKFDSAKLTSAAAKDSAGVFKTLGAYGSALDSLAAKLIDNEGLISTRTEGIKNSSKLIDSQMELLNLRLTQIEKNYKAQFTALDTLMGKLQTTSSYLTQQISAFNKS